MSWAGGVGRLAVSLTVLLFYGSFGSLAMAAPALSLRPISSTTPYQLIGTNEIILPSGGGEVTLEIIVTDWGGPTNLDELRAFQATIEPAGYLGGNAVPSSPGIDLVPLGHPGNPSQGAFQATSVCAISGRFCNTGQPSCTAPEGACIPNARFVLSCCQQLAVVITPPSLDYAFAGSSTLIGQGAVDQDDPDLGYCGTLTIVVPAAARGTYTIGFDPTPSATLIDAGVVLVSPALALVPARITVIASGSCCWSSDPEVPFDICEDDLTSEECNLRSEPRSFRDGLDCLQAPCVCDCPSDPEFCTDFVPGAPSTENLCTDDICTGTEQCCVHTLLYDPQSQCCDPSIGPEGGLTPLDDGDSCTEDVCEPLTGTVTHYPFADGAACDDGWVCTVDDVCAAGICGGTNINTQACAEDEDCAVGLCNIPTGLCRCLTPRAAPALHDTPKNRYVAFTPADSTTSVAMLISKISQDGVPVFAPIGWVAAPDADGISRILPLTTPLAFVQRPWPEPIVHVGDCAIIPAAEYQIEASTNGIDLSAPFKVRTIYRPAPKHWADNVGVFAGGHWHAPDGLVNINDMVSAIQRFQGLSSAPHVTWVDMDPPCPNKVLNFTDVLYISKGFQGLTYPFSNSVLCASPCAP